MPSVADRAQEYLERGTRVAARAGRAAVRDARARMDKAKSTGLLFDRYSNGEYVEIAYNLILRRDPDPDGLNHFKARLRRREISRLELLELMAGSEEYRFGVHYKDLLVSLHASRCQFVKGLPRARRILDIGGTHQSNRWGAFVRMGYPYPFDELVILDLPHEERHEIYRHSDAIERVDTPLGPVSYQYGSMADLSQYEDGSFDLVYSGQSFEHVTPADGDLTLKEVFRVLGDTGVFALDTPNGPVCRMQMEGFINPDHKVEYSDAEMRDKLVGAGFTITDAKGLNYIGGPAATTVFSSEETAAHDGLFDAIEDCYLLAYVARKSPER